MTTTCLPGFPAGAKPLRHIFRDQLVDSVRPFVLKDELFGWPGEGDPLFRAIRKFYLLIPLSGLTQAWPDTLKLIRRKLIRDHLLTVCKPDCLDGERVDEVDRWLTNIQAPRLQLAQYGRHVEEAHGKICFICGNVITDHKTIDHVLPLSRGGADDLSNYRLAHKHCNSAKNNLLVGDNVIWAPNSLATNLHEIPSRLRYLVFLRDDFTCKKPGCSNGLHSGTELTLGLRFDTGIACYDNLLTFCKFCHASKEESNV